MTRTPVLLVALVSLMLACSAANTSPPPASPNETDNFASFGVGGLTPGAKILINKNNQWLPGNVVRQASPGHYQVHYDGFGPEWDESVAMDRIRPQQDGAGARDYRVGEKVLVKMQNRLLLGEIVQQVSPTSWRVHYDGYGPEVAENVGADRMRRPHPGASGHGVGEPLGVDVGGGRILPAKVLAVVAADRWIVRFDGFGPEYDQEIGADRVKDVPKSAEPPPTAPNPPPVAGATADKDAGKGKDKGKDKGKEKDKGKDKAPPAPEPAAVPTGPLQSGEAVLVAHRGTFYPATIAAAGPAGAFRVKYESGATGVAEEEVSADRIVRVVPQPKGTPFTQNQKVFIEWHGMFFPGKVVKEQEKGQYRVRYEGTGPESDEVVISKRVRPRP